MLDDNNEEVYERDEEAQMKPKRRKEDQADFDFPNIPSENNENKHRRWGDTIDRDSIVQLYRELNKTAEKIAAVQERFSEEVNKLDRRVSKYNGLWEHQEKQDRALTDLSRRVDDRFSTLVDSINTLSRMHTECIAERRGQSNTVKFMKEYVGWILATILSIRALWRG